MSLNASTAPMSSGKRKEPVAIGTYMARLVQVIDMGLQPQSFNGQEKEPKHEVNLTYELVTEFMKDDEGKPDTSKPRWVGESFPLNNIKADLAKSTKRIKAIDPTNQFKGDLVAMLGQPCLVTIVHNKSKANGNIYANISLVTSAMAGIPCPPLVNEPKFFDLSNPNIETFLSLPEFMQERVKSNLEFPGSKLARMLNDAPAETTKQEEEQSQNNDDDCPF